jgi:cupin fold WbuC family metalloprotein
MPMRRISEAVYVAEESVVRVTRSHIEWLKDQVAETQRRRVRLCAHKSGADSLHEMLIVLDGAGYVRPHRHRNKSESFHVVEGQLSVVLLAEDGQVREVIRLGEYGSGRPFFYRLEEPVYHTVVVESASAVIHETTNGPFDRTETEFAPWAPAEEEADASRSYLDGLRMAVRRETYQGRKEAEG